MSCLGREGTGGEGRGGGRGAWNLRGTKLFRTSNFIGPCYREALSFSGLVLLFLLFIMYLLFSEPIL